jgi:NAD(P)-dependent dehydrogenase (short-subunit alcohol dehydrogenase family)
LPTAEKTMSRRPCVCITGAAKGIGAETALLFARHGYHLGATDISKKDLA